ncbi:MAG: ligand-binding sensor domain-containing protein [Bacteroidales bacterium]
MIVLFSGVAIAARNQESRMMEQWSEGPVRMNAVVVGAQGVKWFGTDRGLLLYDGLSHRYFTTADGLTGNLINALEIEAAAPGGALWVATQGGVTSVTPEAGGISGIMTYTTGEGLLDDSVTAVVVDGRSRKFFGSVSGITWIHGDTVGYLTYDDFNASMVNAPVRRIEVFNDTLYVAQEGGIGRFVSGVDGVSGASRWTSEYGMSPLSGNILSVLVDSRGHQWFGTDMGVQEHAGQQAKENWMLYTMAEGLVDNRVISMAEDGEGGMWFGTTGGLSWLKEGIWTSFTTADGLLNDTVMDIGVDAEGAIWLATARGYCSYRDGTFTDQYTSIGSLPAPDREVRVWYNPADRSVYVSYRLTGSASVSARLFLLNGKLAGIWSDLPSAPGWQQTVLPLSAMNTGDPGGIYILQLHGGAWTESRKLWIPE